MTNTTESRQAGREYASNYTKGEDPNENQAEVLCSDELFGEVAHSLSTVETQLKYSDSMSDLTREKLRNSKRQLQFTLEARAEDLLEEWKKPAAAPSST
jgi:hypothetical protein